jgi:hypothetical protein
MQEAIDAAGLGGSGDFLEHFKLYGWYLDDLVLTPVNQLEKAERKAKCLESRKSLTERIVKWALRRVIGAP